MNRCYNCGRLYCIQTPGKHEHNRYFKPSRRDTYRRGAKLVYSTKLLNCTRQAEACDGDVHLKHKRIEHWLDYTSMYFARDVKDWRKNMTDVITEYKYIMCIVPQPVKDDTNL